MSSFEPSGNTMEVEGVLRAVSRCRAPIQIEHTLQIPQATVQPEVRELPPYFTNTGAHLHSQPLGSLDIRCLILPQRRHWMVSIALTEIHDMVSADRTVINDDVCSRSATDEPPTLASHTPCP